LKILALDSATSSCSAAVQRDGIVLAERFDIMERGQSEALVPMIRDVLEESDLRIADLDMIATTVGPGAFTGLRICLATARALALAARLPVVGITTFQAVALAQGIIDLPLLVAIDSKRSDCYVQLFDEKRVAVGSPSAILPTSVEEILPHRALALAGTAADLVKAALDASGRDTRRLRGHDYPHAVQVADLAAERAARAMPRYGDVPPEPIYLKAPDVTVAGSGPLSRKKGSSRHR
jgi:tRNA threonylcarbamoyladenosine biosynthesis protein TsaB